MEVAHAAGDLPVAQEMIRELTEHRLVGEVLCVDLLEGEVAGRHQDRLTHRGGPLR